jgi:hypothetical protein
VDAGFESVGSTDGVVGSAVGRTVGPGDGAGKLDGMNVESAESVGTTDGVVGSAVGRTVGPGDGAEKLDGMNVESAVGAVVRVLVGGSEGDAVGSEVDGPVVVGAVVLLVIVGGT